MLIINNVGCCGRPLLHCGASVEVQVFELVPTRVGGGVASACVVGIVVDEVDVEVVVAAVDGRSAVLAQQRAHGSVAFAGGVDVLDGDGERDGVVYHIGHVDVGVAVGYLQKLVGVVAVVVAIFDYNMVYGVDGEGEVVEATVAGYDDFAAEGEMQVVVVVFVLDFEVHFDVGIAHIVVLHVDKKLLTYLVVKLLAAYGHAFERQFIFSKLTHIFCQLAKNFAKVAKFFRFINFFENYFLMVVNFGAKCGGVVDVERRARLKPLHRTKHGGGADGWMGMVYW